MGRLGNQMFQFASTLGISEKLGYTPVFPLENCFNYQGSGPFDPSIGRNMRVKCDLLDCFEISQRYFIPERHIEILQTYSESDFKYDKGTESIKDGSCLYGYFQTEKYFKHIRDLIVSEFSFRSDHLKKAENYIRSIKDKIGNSKIISLHVRRGDYVMFQDYHPTCSEGYYKSAQEEMVKNHGDAFFLVFSDDVDWCKNEFKNRNHIVCELLDPYSEMCCMTLCDHHIIANSSFSWWGAWLNKKENKEIIAPSRWFGPLINKDTSDVYCDNWRIM